MKRFLLLLALLALYIPAGAQSKTNVEEYKSRVYEVAHAKRIPMVQAFFKTPTETVSFESSQCGFIYAAEDASHTFLVASLSKPVLAYVCLRMYDKGQIDLDTPIYKYTSIDRFTNKDWAMRITPRMVMTHMTGLPNWPKDHASGFTAHGSTPNWPDMKVDFLCEPGTKFTYSGEATALLQRAMEAIRGQSLQQIAYEEMFAPLGMNSTSYGWLDAYEQTAIEAYDAGLISLGKFRQPRENAAYSLRSTASDYAKFAEAVMTGKGLKPETYKQMIDPVIEMNAEKNLYRGLGIQIEKHPQYGDIYYHSGSTGPFKTFFMTIPKTQTTLVYFSNGYKGSEIRGTMKNIFLGSKYVTNCAPVSK